MASARISFARITRSRIWHSSTGPHDQATGEIVGDTVQEQTRQCLENISFILEAAGASLESVVSASIVILEQADFAGMNEEWITVPTRVHDLKVKIKRPGDPPNSFRIRH
jgi:enamine deaminase RidA (YjgF/YER057c/UK114 family)